MRKYMSEFGLHVYTSESMILPSVELELNDRILEGHLYAVLAADKVYILPETLQTDADGIKCTFVIHSSGGTEKYENFCWKFPFNIDHSRIKATSVYPHDVICVEVNDPVFSEKHQFDPNQELLVQQLFDVAAKNYMNDRGFQVLYVGKAFGEKGKRVAADRLKSHSTLQKILMECQGLYPNKYIYILVMDFTPRLMCGMTGMVKEYKKSDEEDTQHISDVLTNLPPMDQIVNITEAAMINYFKPKYNTMFKENFPRGEHKSYRHYYDFDYADLTVEFDLGCFQAWPNIQLYTETNQINRQGDTIRYHLHNDIERTSMYHIFSEVDE